MIKSIFKEIIIMLLLCVAIVLVLGVLFYDYIPTSKIVPSKVSAYKTPENVTEEIAEQITEFEKTNIVYEITDADLNVYKQSKSYNPGKPDPFSSEAISTNTGTTSNTNNNGSQNNGEDGQNNQENNNNQNNGNQQTTNENNSSNTNTNNANNKNESETSETFFNETGLK